MPTGCPSKSAAPMTPYLWVCMCVRAPVRVVGVCAHVCMCNSVHLRVPVHLCAPVYGNGENETFPDQCIMPHSSYTQTHT